MAKNALKCIVSYSLIFDQNQGAGSRRQRLLRLAGRVGRRALIAVARREQTTQVPPLYPPLLTEQTAPREDEVQLAGWRLSRD